MATNPRWPVELYGQDLNRWIPSAVTIVGGIAILQKSFNNQPFNITSDASEVIIVITGSYAVQPTDTIILINLPFAGTVLLQLPPVSTRLGLILGIADIGGNATINIAADTGETIMGLTSVTGLPAGVAGQLVSSAKGLGSGASAYLRPVSSISGWVNI